MGQIPPPKPPKMETPDGKSPPVGKLRGTPEGKGGPIPKEALFRRGGLSTTGAS